MTKHHQTEAAFNATLRERLRNPTSSSQMHMTSPPTGASKSLEELVANGGDEAAGGEAPIGAPHSEQVVGALRMLKVRSIKRSPFQPRVRLDPAQVDVIAESIRTDSLNDPVTVRPYTRVDGDPEEWEYELIAGEHRWAAHQILGKEAVPAIIKQFDDRKAARMAVMSNTKRGGLAPYEEYRGYQMLIDGGFVESQNQMARDAGKSRTEMSRLMSFGKLPAGAKRVLDEKPALIGSNVANALAAFSQHPDYERLVVEVLQKIDSEELDQTKAASWVERQIVEAALRKYAQGRPTLVAAALRMVDAGELDRTNAVEWVETRIKEQDGKRSGATAQKRAVTLPGGRPFASLEPSGRGYRIDLNKGVTLGPDEQERLELALVEFLSKFAQQLPDKTVD